MVDVSFIIPIFNDEKYIYRIVDNIRRQNISNYEIIFVDDGSTDASQKRINEINDKNIKYVKNATNCGPGFSRNKGLKVATGNYVRFVDADDLLPGNSTNELLKLAMLYNAKVVRGSYICVDELNRTLFEKRIDKLTVITSNSLSDLILKALDGHWCYLIKRNFLINNKLHYAEGMTRGEDAYLLQEILRKKEKIVYSPIICYKYVKLTTGERLTNKRDWRAPVEFNILLSKFFDISKEINRGDLFYKRFANAFDFIYKQRIFYVYDSFSKNERKAIIDSLKRLLVKTSLLGKINENLTLKNKIGRFARVLWDVVNSTDKVLTMTQQDFVKLDCYKEIDVNGVIDHGKSLPIYAWTGRLNFGDILIFDYLRYKGIRYYLSTLTQCKMITVGSILHNFLMSKRNIGSNKKLYVWGSGFIAGTEPEIRKLIGPFAWEFNRNIEFCALRGRLSKEMVQSITKIKLDIPLGDPGLLVREIYPGKVDKIYDLGVVLHWKESTEDIRKFIRLSKYSFKFINPADTPEKVIDEIKKCRVIISSSLHGLIVSDAFGIPNRHMLVTEKVEGGTFKFRDYYSAYNDYPYVNFSIRRQLVTDRLIEDILTGYINREDEIKQINKRLINSYPNYAKMYINPLRRLFKQFF